MTLEVNYQLANLPDKLLRWMIGQTELDDLLEQSPMARELNLTLQNEQIRRLKVVAGGDPAPVTLTLPLMNFQQACEAFFELTAASSELVAGIAGVEPSKPELADAVREGVEFLKSVALAVNSYAKMIRSTDAGPAN